MRPAMASTPQVGDVWKAPVIYKAALHYIFLSSLRGWDRGAFLKNYRGKPYKATGRIYVLHNSLLWKSNKLLVELPNIFILLIIERALLD